MQFIRIGEKLISEGKLNRVIEKILQLRAQGYSQKEVAERLQIERSFISHLESIGQIRRGERVALIGFPVANKEEVQELAEEMGIDFTMILSEEERWSFIKDRNGITLFNELLQLIKELQEYQKVVFIGSDMRVETVQSLLEGEVIGLPLGPSPIQKDMVVDLEKLREILEKVKEKDKDKDKDKGE